MRKLLNTIHNYLLQLNSILRYYNVYLFSKRFSLAWDYRPVAIDTFIALTHWRKGLWWGNFHPDSNTYTKDENVEVETMGVKLMTKYDPTTHDGKEYKYSQGTIYTKIFSYGYFEVNALIQRGKSLWHAPLWFVAVDRVTKEITALPELDVCELYSDRTGRRYKAKSNVHYGKSYKPPHNRDLGALNHALRIDGKTVHQFGCLWTRNSIKIYYDRYLVRVINDKNVIRRFNNSYLRPIIGSGVSNKKTAKDTPSMLVTKFTHHTKT